MNGATKTIIEAALKADHAVNAKQRTVVLEILDGTRDVDEDGARVTHNLPALLKLSEVAHELSCTRQTAARLVKEGLIEPVVLRKGSGTVRTGDLIRYRRSDVERIVAGRTT